MGDLGSNRIFRRAFVGGIIAGTLAVSPGRGEGIFHDGFDECGAGRWSSGDPTPPGEQLTDLEPLDLARAFGACAPSLLGAQFVYADGTAPGVTELGEMSDQQSAVLDAFGTGGLVPRAGGRMIALSSGKARDTGHPGFAGPEPGTQFGRSTSGPAAFLSAHNNMFPGIDGCPDGTGSAYDSVGIRLIFLVPESADRLLFEWRYVASDRPEWVCTAFIDYFLGVVIAGSSPSIPLDRNVAVDSANRPISVDSPDIDFCTGCSGGDAIFAGTGFAGNDAGATDWRTASIPVVGGEVVILDLLAFDVGDGTYDNVVLLDGMRWISD